jgi:hypothetical protein
MRVIPLKGETILGIVLVGVLGFYGWQPAKTILAHRQVHAAAVGKRLLRTEGGIDVYGNLVRHLPPPKAKRTIVFLLRGGQVRADLEFWRNVESLLPKDTGFRLVGYCDGDACANAVKGEALQPDFPVIAYGEIGAGQAMVEADAQGEAFILSEEWFQPRRLGWRSQGRSPLSVVQEASK